MADKIELKITGDSEPIKKALKKAKKLVEKFEKVVEKTAKQQETATKKANKAITRDRHKHFMIAGRISKDLRREQINELKKTIAQDKRLSRKRAKNRLKAIRSRIREEKRLEKRAARDIARFRKKLFRVGRIGGIVGALGGIGALFESRKILDFDVALARTSVQANRSIKDQMRLRKSLTDTAVEFGVQRDVIADAVSRIVDKSGDFDLAANNLDKLAKVLRGTGVDSRSLGELIASLAATFRHSGDDVFSFLEILISQGDKAQINIVELATEAEKLLGAFTAAGLKGKKQFIEFGALVQVSGLGGGKAEAATFTANLLNQLSKRSEDIEAAIGKKITGKGGRLIGIRQIIENIMEGTKGDLTELQKLIPEIRALKPLQLMGIEYQDMNKELKTFVDLIAAGDTAFGNIEKKYERVAMTPSQGFERMVAAFTKLSDIALLPMLDQISDSIINLVENEDKMKNLVKAFQDFGKTLAFVAKVGAGIADVVNPMLERRNRKLRNYERTKRLPTRALRREAIKGRLFSLSPSRVIEQNLDKIELRIKNEFKQDEKGRVKSSQMTTEYQKDSGRGKLLMGKVQYAARH
jgi:hypothetical protein